MNGLPLAHEVIGARTRPALQPHSINLTQHRLPLSEADRRFSGAFMRTREHQIRISGYGSQINATTLRHLWHVRCLDASKRAVAQIAMNLSFAGAGYCSGPGRSGHSRQHWLICRWLETR